MLADVPIVFMLIGLVAYAVLAGADFGAGFWTLFAGGGRATRSETRTLARHAIGPVWEANHVWLIFVLVVCWTAYPRAFASIMSTLAVPLFVAAIGIILRGTAYALRSVLDDDSGRRGLDNVFSLSSLLTPFALGTVVGAIASGRVPVGNARGDLVTSWLNPTSITIGVLAVVSGAYLAAVYLAADAHRLGNETVERDFRTRALVSGVVAGGLALAGLPIVRHDARPIWNGLTHGAGAAMVGLSAAAGLVTLALVLRNRFGPARLSAALAVSAIVAGWAFAQRPQFLPGLTVTQAAAGHTTLVAVVVAVAAGGLIVLPSLALLFTLLLRGRLEPMRTAPSPDTGAHTIAPSGGAALAALAVATAVAGTAALVFADGGWVLGAGVACIFACAVSAFILANASDESSGELRG